MLDQFMLYARMHIGAECGIWILTAAGLCITGLILSITVTKFTWRNPTVDKIIEAAGDTLLITGLGLVGLGIVSMFALLITASSIPAPAKWFAHIPVKESQFFQKHMQRMHNGVSIDKFARLENSYADSIRKHVLIEQQDELMSQDKTAPLANTRQ